MLRRCLASVQSTIACDYEAIIVDNDGADESVKEVISSFSNDKFIYLQQPIVGVSAARNLGIEHAKSELILFLDDDDELEEHALQYYQKFMSETQQQNIAFTWCGVIKLFENSEHRVINKKEFSVSQKDLDDMSFIVKIGTGCGLCVRKQALNEICGFDEKYKLSEDRNLLLSLIKQGKKYRPLNKLLYKRHYHPGERLSKHFHALEEAHFDRQLYYQHLEFIGQYPALQIRLLDLMAGHYFDGGEKKKAIEISKHAWNLQLLRMKGGRRFMIYWLKDFFSSTKKKVEFNSSMQYWRDRYEKGKNSGVGSYGLFADFKAGIINNFVDDHKINDVIELGCGDGNQLHLAKYNQYTGFDVSERALEICKMEFSADTSKQFKLMADYNDEKYDLGLSLDVIYHLVEDEVFEKYMNTLFSASKKYVIIYSSNQVDESRRDGKHVRHRKFTQWLDENINNWKLIEIIPNKYPYKGNYKTGSFADFYIYERMSFKEKVLEQ